MSSYLDKTGLTYLWSKITTALSGKADSADIPTVTSDLTNDSGFVTSSAITTIVSISESDYNALSTKDANTLYVITS